MLNRFVDFFIEIYPLIAAITSVIVAQLLKGIHQYIKNNKLDLRRTFGGSGGMPSSHSAMVSSLTTAIGLQEGFTSPLFCMCIIFSLIVFYDAAGVRQEAGKQAGILNQMMDDLFDRGEIKADKLKELIGHTPLEIVVGSLLGIGIAFTLYY